MGTDPRTEGLFVDPAIPPPASHVRKAGPRLDAAHDAVRIFRRGVPYSEVDNNGEISAGLQFVSFQWSTDLFNTIYRRWMFNPSFPPGSSGNDALLDRGLIQIQKGGLFFIPPGHADEGFIGSGVFEMQKPPKKVKEGKVVIRKTVADPTASLAGIRFQLLKAADSIPVGAPFATTAAGHAESEKVPVGEYLVQETAPATFQPIAPIPVTIDRGATPLTIPNTVVQPGYR